MERAEHVYIGIDGGATTSKVAAVWRDGTPVSTTLLQWPTNARHGPDAVVRGWVDAVDAFLKENGLAWERVQGVGLSIPGPFVRYGVFGQPANLPASFIGFDVLTSCGAALTERCSKVVPLVVGNDGNMAGVAEAQRVRGTGISSVLMLAPGSGLGCAYIDRTGLPLDGDTLNGMEGGHMPAPLHELNVRPYPCGCGRTWGCVEVYTSISGLRYLLAEKLTAAPDHELARSELDIGERVLALRGLAQRGDRLATEIFDFQARALGLHVANLVMALDPEYVVIGGGLMEPEATTAEFRERYLRIVHETALPYLWASQRPFLRVVPAELGDLSQAIGAALVALRQSRP